MYQIELTSLAKAFAFKIGGEEALLAQAREELTEVIADGCPTHDNGCPDLLFHTFAPRDSEGKPDWGQQNFICAQQTIDGSPGIIIDTATPEESSVELKEGKFKGHKIVIPSPDTLDDLLK
jgi:hypothetical protein